MGKLDAFFQLLLEDVLDLNAMGTTLQQLQDPGSLQLLKEMVMAKPSQLSTERIGALMAAYRRWKRFAVAKGYPMRSPTALQLAEFFQVVSKGGPTAASSAWQSLQWYKANVGVDFPMQHWLVTPYKFIPASHNATQALELEPWELVNLMLFTKRQLGTNLILACFVLQAALSCIRFEHVQRSRPLSETRHAALYRCAQGKRRVRGSRPGYVWATPALEFQGFSLLKVLVEFYKHECLSDVPFLWPQVQLEASDLWEIHQATPFLVSKKMSRSRFLEIFRGMLHQAGAPHEQSAAAGFNRLRRFLPTLGNVLRLEPPEMQAVGSWVEIPAGGGPSPQTKSRAVWLMGRHYSGGQAERSAAVKVALMERFWQLFRRKQGDLAITHDHLLPRGSWSWQELAAANDQMPPLEFKLPQVMDVEVADPAGLAETEAPPQPEAPLDEGTIHDDDSSSTTSSSASDESARGSDLDGVVPLDELDNLQWIKQGSKVHVVKGLDDAGRPVPWCRDLAFAQDAKASCQGFSTSARQNFCQRCIARMPRGVYSALAAQCGWVLAPAHHSACSSPFVLAIMSAASKIDVLEDDRGLRTCFEAANVTTEWRKPFMAVHKVETLDDFVYLVDRDRWETSLKDLLESVAELKGNRIILARFKAAFESGMAAIKASQAAPKSEEQADQVLPEATLQSVTAAFFKKYGVILDPHTDPSDALRSRIYREFRRGTMSLLEAKRIKSMLNITVPKTQDNIKLSDSVRLQLQEDETISITSSIEYYMQLRTLMNAWGWAGLFEAKDYDGQRKTFLSWGEALQYADFALRSTAEIGQGSLQWMSRNDLLTRSKMASLIRRGYTGGSALEEALKQTHIEWRSPALQSSGSLKTGRSAPPPGPDVAPVPKRPRQIKSDTIQTVSMVKGGKRLCKSWNDNRGLAIPRPTLGSCAGKDSVLDRNPKETQTVMPAAPPPARHVFVDGPGEAPTRSVTFEGATSAPSLLLDTPHSSTSLSKRLAAAKPVVRGLSDLPQFAWANLPFKGNWLVLDLWGGFSGLCIACLTLGIHFFALSAESDSEARACSAQAMPNIVHIDAVEKLQVRDLREFLSRRHIRGILLGGLAANLTPPESWTWAQHDGPNDAVPELRYVGAKPVPPRIHWEEGFHPMIDPLKVMQSGGNGALHTFTREFFHPADRTSQVTPAAAQRFLDDNRRFPPGAYEEHSLLWKQDLWRTPTPSERAQAMGVPLAAVAAVQGPPELRRAKQNSLLGNGFHIPSILVLLMLLPQLFEAKLLRQPRTPDFELRERLSHTIWAPGRLDTMPDLLSAEDITREMRLMLPFPQVPQATWMAIQHRLQACRLPRLQAYSAWRRVRGESWTLPPGLGPEEHIQQSATLPSPFRPRDWPEPDVLFVVECICAWHDALPALAAEQRKILQAIATAVAPLAPL
eukprot:s1719_g6.t1